MPRTINIGSAADPRLADYTRLTDVALRTHLEAEHGLFMAEGTKVITRAAEAGYTARSVLLAESRLGDLPALGAPAEVPVYIVPDEVAERLTGYRVHRGALGQLPVEASAVSHSVVVKSFADGVTIRRVIPT